MSPVNIVLIVVALLLVGLLLKMRHDRRAREDAADDVVPSQWAAFTGGAPAGQGGPAAPAAPAPAADAWVVGAGDGAPAGGFVADPGWPLPVDRGWPEASPVTAAPAADAPAGPPVWEGAQAPGPQDAGAGAPVPGWSEPRFAPVAPEPAPAMPAFPAVSPVAAQAPVAPDAAGPAFAPAPQAAPVTGPAEGAPAPRPDGSEGVDGPAGPPVWEGATAPSAAPAQPAPPAEPAFPVGPPAWDPAPALAGAPAPLNGSHLNGTDVNGAHLNGTDLNGSHPALALAEHAAVATPGTPESATPTALAEPPAATPEAGAALEQAADAAAAAVPAWSDAAGVSAPDAGAGPGGAGIAWWDLPAATEAAAAPAGEALPGDVAPADPVDEGAVRGRFAVGGHAIMPGQPAVGAVSFPRRPGAAPERWVVRSGDGFEDDAVPPGALVLRVDAQENCVDGSLEVLEGPGVGPSADGVVLRVTAQDMGPFMVAGTFRIAGGDGDATARA